MKEAKSLQNVASELLLSRDSLQELFSLVCKLYSRAVTFPVSTTDCEWAFSAMNGIITHLRSSLKTSTLEKVMPISLEGPSQNEFDFAAAMQWPMGEVEEET